MQYFHSPNLLNRGVTLVAVISLPIYPSASISHYLIPINSKCILAIFSDSFIVITAVPMYRRISPDNLKLLALSLLDSSYPHISMSLCDKVR
jgi:hypothetical protein